MSDQIAQPATAPEAGAMGPWDARLGVLRHRHFRNVWLASFGSNVGMLMEHVGVQWLFAEQTRSVIALGYLAAAQFAPLLLLSLAGGLAADRIERRRLLLATQTLLMLVAASLMVASALDRATVPVLIVLAALNGVGMAFNIPAWQVLTPRLVPRDELARAIALNGVQFNLARVVGPALAGVLLAWAGATALFVINTASFLVVIGAVLTTPPAPVPPAARGGVRGVWTQLAEAFAYVFRERGPRAAFLAMVVYSLLATPLTRILPLFASEVYHAGARTFGIMLALMGAGAVVGGLALRHVPTWYPKHHLIPISVAAGGLATAAFSATDNVVLAGIAMTFFGIFWLWAFTLTSAALQLLVDDAKRGRVMSICNTAVFGAMPLGALLAGSIGEFASGRADSGVGAQVGVGVLGAVLAVAGLVMLVWRTPEVDGLQPGDPGFERRPGLIRGLTASAHRHPPASPRGAPAE